MFFPLLVTGRVLLLNFKTSGDGVNVSFNILNMSTPYPCNSLTKLSTQSKFSSLENSLPNITFKIMGSGEIIPLGS